MFMLNIKHVQQHTWKVVDLCTRDDLPTRWNTICTHQAFYSPGGNKRNLGKEEEFSLLKCMAT